MDQGTDHKTSWWRWLLVAPAFLFGFVPGFLVRISWELGTSWIPGVEFLMDRWAEVLQSGVDGYCVVYFATWVAPHGKVATSIVAALLIAVVAGAALMLSLGESNLWNSGLIVVTIVGAGIAVWYTIEAGKSELEYGPSNK